jgi:hypothetical protein
VEGFEGLRDGAGGGGADVVCGEGAVELADARAVWFARDYVGAGAGAAGAEQAAAGRVPQTWRRTRMEARDEGALGADDAGGARAGSGRDERLGSMQVWAKDRDAGKGGGIEMAMMMSKVKMELSRGGWTVVMMPPTAKVKPEKMSLGELLYFALMGEGTMV